MKGCIVTCQEQREYKTKEENSNTYHVFLKHTSQCTQCFQTTVGAVAEAGGKRQCC